MINEKYRNSIVFNLLAMLLLAVAIYLVFFSSLGWITNHGEQVKMPSVIDRNVNDALSLLEKYDFEIDIDSSFDMKKQPGVVLSQMPDTGSFVKKGRTVFIMVNKVQPPLTTVPDLAGVSYRSADMVLRSNKLRLGDTIHRPDIADGAILELTHKGKVIAPGDMLPQGSVIDLVIGDGLSNVEIDVPNVVGLTYPEGIAMINALGLQFIDIWEGRITDSATAVIYFQSPEAVNELGGYNKVKQGDLIDIKIRQSGQLIQQQQGPGNNNKPQKPVNSGEDSDGGDW